MDRREWISGVTGLAMASLATAAQAQHEGHQHHAVPPGRKAVIEAAGACVARGEECLAHCLVLLSTGDKTLAACAQSVSETVAGCGALQKLAAQDSTFGKRMAGLVREMCKACEDECRKHEDKHAECKACAEACVDCARACEAYAA